MRLPRRQLSLRARCRRLSVLGTAVEGGARREVLGMQVNQAGVDGELTRSKVALRSAPLT